MKKLLTLLLALLLVCPSSLADGQWVVSWEPVGEQYNREGTKEIILSVSVSTPDGKHVQTFPAIKEENAPDGGVIVDDVNRDGYDDLAVVTVMGTSNIWHAFYVWNPAQYRFVPVKYEPLCNYHVREDGYIASYGQNGWAGLLHETDVYKWSADGTELIFVASSEWNTYEEETFTFGQNDWTMTTRGDDRFITETYRTAAGDEMTFTFETDKYMNDEAFYHQRAAYEESFLFPGANNN